MIFKFFQESDIEIVECLCTEHKGKEMLNKKFNLSVSHVYDCMFNANSDFNMKFEQLCKHLDVKNEEWKLDDTNVETRKQEYSVDMGSLGTPKNITDQVRSNFFVASMPWNISM